MQHTIPYNIAPGHGMARQAMDRNDDGAGGDHGVSDDDDDDNNDAPQAGTASNLSEKRRAQKAIFESWLTSSDGHEALKPKDRHSKDRDETDEQKFIHTLLAQQQRDTPIVQNPRAYQEELFQRAVKENTIAVLDTGSGKTLIAVLLLRHIIDQELERRAAGQPPKIAFFLVASVTLLYQQFSVLETNLDHKIARLCGADNIDHWSTSNWLGLFRENKIVVCTAEILFQCLFHGFLAMRQINLLIFDEAHHAKKNHVYARIIKDFYLTEPSENRPRVFGMTASPVDAKTDFIRAAAELESLLDCKIATTQNMTLAEAVKRPAEHILRYAPLLHVGYETPLLQMLNARFGHMDVFETTFARAAEVARHMGRWCADSFLLQAFSHEKTKKYEVDIEKKFHARRLRQNFKELDQALSEVRDAINFTQQQRHVIDCNIESADLSSKVWQLHSFLRMQFERESRDRAIVFVDRRYTARVLHTVFQKIGSPHMRGQFLVGSGNAEVNEDSFSFREQVMTLLQFRKGELNCLFATSVAEEGLDVPDCNLVVRFDMYRTMIQYIQSRGRARNQHSKYIHMIEKGNAIHDQLVIEVRSQEQAMRHFCGRLPDDRKLQGNDDCLEQLFGKTKHLQVRTEPSTGAKMTYGNALGILAQFVSAIPTESDEPQHPTYIVTAQGQKFLAEVILPGNAPVRSVIGQLHPSKALAKRSAAFDACIILRQKQLLDEHFMPTYQKKLPAMRNALLAVDMKKQDNYEMRLKPRVWSEQRGALPTELWVTIIDFPERLDRPHQPLAFLTRSPMPCFPRFPVFLNGGRGTPVASVAIDRPLTLDNKTLMKLTRFTMRVFEDVFSKTYEEDAAKLSYWILPGAVSLDDPRVADQTVRNLDPQSAIDWLLVDEVFTVGVYNWTPEMPNDFLANRFVVDVWDGSRKFISIGVDTTRKAIDPIPEDVAKSKHTGTILDYSISLWKKARAAKDATWLRSQPVMRAEKILARRNMLAAPEQKEIAQSTKAFLCPQPLRISTLPPTVAIPCFVWPAIIHRFESHLIGIEGCTSIGLDIGPAFALAAFTKDSDNQGEYGAEESVRFQRGMGENYERLEFIGDTFLKFATTISTFIMNPNENEFEFHVRRMQMLCNKNLFRTAVQRKLYEYIRSSAFSRRTWYPEGLKLLVGTGVVKGQEKEMFHDAKKHALSEKTIADVCEALIGGAYLTYDHPDEWQPQDWETAIRAVTVLVDSPDHTMLKWEDYRAAYKTPTYQTGDVTAVQRDLAEKIQSEHDYCFKYPRLLYSAFLHPSMPFLFEKMPSYQRLEFLGDGLLDLASISYLFYGYPGRDPHWLTEHKMAMVSNKFLGALCVNLGFHKHLRHHSAILEHQVRNYATELLEAKRVAGESRDYWTTVSDPPKCLPDIVESYVGAMFIDSDFDYGQVQRFFDTHVRWYFEDMSIYDTFANNHPCTHLHSRLQTEFGCMDYCLMAKELPSVDGMEKKDIVAVVMVHDRIIAYSKGKSGRYARLRVAVKALEVLEGLAPYGFREKYGCECGIDYEIETDAKSRSDGLASDCGV